MFRIALPLLSAPLLLALAACTPDRDTTSDTADAAATPAPIAPTADPAVPDPATDGSCDAAALQSLVGQEATEGTIEQARERAGAGQVRTLAPGQVVTLEFNGERLNLAVDEANVITGVHCG